MIVSLRTWTTAVVTAASVAAAAPRAAPAIPAPTTGPTAPLSSPAPQTPQEDLRQYISRMSAALVQGTAPQRLEAAQRLVEIRGQAAKSVVARALSGNDERTQLACARAIADQASTDPQWLAPLVHLLGRNQALAEAAARALGHYEGNPVAYDALIRAAQSRQAPARLAALRALGQLVERPVAEALVGIVADATDDPAARGAAADALELLSGQTSNGHDPGRWNLWWAARLAKDPAAWRTQVLAEQHAQLQRAADHARDHLTQFKAAVRDLLWNQYNREAVADRARTLLGFLDSANPEIRQIGASIVPDAVASGQPMTDEIHKRLIELLGDASVDVRTAVVQAVTKLGDPNALDAIVTQLQIETEPSVKILLISALANINNDAAISVLRTLLHDPSMEVAATAADAIGKLAQSPAGLRGHPAQAREVAQELEAVLRERTGPPGQPTGGAGAGQLRAALVAALAALSANATPASTIGLFSELLSQTEAPQTRRAAVLGLGLMGENSGAGDLIVRELDSNFESDPQVRQGAAMALGDLGSFDYARPLDISTQPGHEPNPQVREAAWNAFQKLLPSASPRALNEWASQFGRRKQFDRELAVLKELATKLEAAHDAQDLAPVRQHIGEIYYVNLNQPAEAVPYLREALAHFEAMNSQQSIVVDLVREVIVTLLKSGQYQDAVKFGQDEIRRDRANQLEIGPAIRDAADQLIQKHNETGYQDADALIQAATNMNPPLDENYREQLQTLRQSIPPR